MASEPSKHDLLYLLERVKAACSDRYGEFLSVVGSEEYEMCLILEQDGLIRKSLECEDNCYWRYEA